MVMKHLASCLEYCKCLWSVVFPKGGHVSICPILCTGDTPLSAIGSRFLPLETGAPLSSPGPTEYDEINTV